MWKDEPVKAIELVKAAKSDFFVGNPWKRRHPHGRTDVQVPLMYNSFVLDLIGFDPISFSVLPKGIPHVMTEREPILDLERVKEVVKEAIEGLVILPGAEFREPEDAWVIPGAYNHLIIAHIRVSHDGSALVPDFHATSMMRLNV